MAVALEKLAQAFAKPEITEAINKLADSLPKLADLAGKAVGFAVDNPGKAAALGVGGIAAQGAIGGIGAAAFSGLSAKILGSFTAGGAQAASTMAAGVASGGAQAGSAMGAAMGGIPWGTYGALFAAAVIAGGLLRKAHDEKVDEEKKAALDKVNEAGKASGIMMTEESAGGPGSDVRARAYRFEERDAEGNVRTKVSPVMKAFKIANAVAEFGTKAGGPEEFGTREHYGTRQKDGGKPLDAKLLAEMLGARELKVRVVNAKEIAGEGGLPPPPTPGGVPR
jgi:hypothetical protein